LSSYEQRRNDAVLQVPNAAATSAHHNALGDVATALAEHRRCDDCVLLDDHQFNILK
jgi:hypothetical protein